MKRVPWSPFAISLLALLSLLPGQEEPANKKLPVPGAKKQTEAKARVREIFKDQWNPRNSDDLLKLASDMIKRGMMTYEDPGTGIRFVLFREARDLAVRGADTTLAMKAVEEMALRYSVEEFELRLETLKRLSRSARKPATFGEIVNQAFPLAFQAIGREDYSTASGLVRLLDSWVRKSRDKLLVDQVRQVKVELRYFQKERDRVKTATLQLLTKRNDPKYNLTVGRYYLLLHRDLEEVIPYLARVKDSALKAACEMELAQPTDPAEQVALGKKWQEAAVEVDSPCRLDGSLAPRWHFLAREFEERALHWYQLAQPWLEGANGTEASWQIQKLTTRNVTDAVGKSSSNFTDTPGEKVYLIGFRWSVDTVQEGGSGLAMLGIKPIFQSPRGRVYGASHGKLQEGYSEVVARPGYAVGGIQATGKEWCRGFQVRFFRLRGSRLDPRDSYETEWLGGKLLGQEVVKMGGTGGVVLGIHGKVQSRGKLRSLGLVLRP